MKSSYVIQDVFHCSLERAFKAPMLGDATRFMKGYLFQPPVSGFDEDDTWGKHVKKTITITKNDYYYWDGDKFTSKTQWEGANNWNSNNITEKEVNL